MPAEADQQAVPYGIIADRLRGGLAVPFLGAGASAIYRPDNTAWEAGSPFLPFGYELSKDLARAANFPDSGKERDLGLVASYYEHVAGDRLALENRLHRLLAIDSTPGSIHRLLARIKQPLLMVTTNYDDLLERAFGNRPFHLVVDRGERNRVWLATSDGDYEPVKSNELRKALTEEWPIIYKLHGNVVRERREHDSFLVTEQDYVDFLGRTQTCVPPYLATRMTGASFLFLGYSLEDWNVRVLLRKLRTTSKNEASALRSWAISYRPGPAEQEIWRAHGVNMYDLDLKVFVRELENEL